MTYSSYTFSLESLQISGLCILYLIFAVILSLLIFSMCVVHYKKVLFLLEPAGYKLVYRVAKFAYQHKVPLRRSAFTYCTLKDGCGEAQVRGTIHYKASRRCEGFLGILKVILSIGPAFLLQTVTHSILPEFAKHAW